MKRTALKRGKPLKRGQPLKRTGFKHKARGGPPGNSEWARRVSREPCRLCGSRRLIEGHHIIYRGKLRERAAERLEQILWDCRNLLVLCRACHGGHHGGLHPISRDLLPPAVFEFAADLGGWAELFVEERYP